MKINNLTPYNSTLSEFGKRLARIRKQQGFSQERLAAQSGIGVATLRRIEDGRDSQLSSWLKILTALQMTATIENLLPEFHSSPMHEVKGNAVRYRRYKASPASSVAAPTATFIWGDEE